MKKGIALGAILVAVLLLALAGYAAADSVTTSGANSASGTVTATATVNPKIALTLTTPNPGQVVDLGAVDPGAPSPTTASVGVQVQSNKAYRLAVTKAGTIVTTGALHFSTSLGAIASDPKPGTTYTDTYSIQPDWNADPGNYSGTVQYTVTQN